MKVLIVEDDPQQVRLVRKYLSDSGLGFCVFDVDSVSGAIECLRRDRQDVVVLDLSLTDSSGLATLKLVARAALDVPIVVLTSADDDDLGLQLLRNGAQEYVCKTAINGKSLVRSIIYTVERTRLNEIERERRNLRKAIKSAENVLGIVGHELRTPLAALRATTEFLMTPAAKESAEWDVFLGSMHGEVTRMAEMVNNLLEAARLNSGRSMWSWGTVDLAVACDDALNVVRPLVPHARVELKCSHEVPDLHLRGDPDAVRRLIINLVSNSAKYTSEGHIHVQTRPLAGDGHQWIEIRVEDTGTGISDVILSKLGQAFVLNSGALGSDYVKGTGLGLSICKAIATAHGGTLTVKSEQGTGTLFIARLRADLDRPARLRRGSRQTITGDAA